VHHTQQPPAATHPQCNSCWSRYSEWCCSDNRANRFTSRSRRGGRKAFFIAPTASKRREKQTSITYGALDSIDDLSPRPTHPPSPAANSSVSSLCVRRSSLNTQSFVDDWYHGCAAGLPLSLTCTVVQLSFIKIRQCMSVLLIIQQIFVPFFQWAHSSGRWVDWAVAIWAECKVIITALRICFNFEHTAPFRNASYAKWTGVKNKAKFRTCNLCKITGGSWVGEMSESVFRAWSRTLYLWYTFEIDGEGGGLYCGLGNYRSGKK